MKHVKQVLACMIAVSMMISGMTGVVTASEPTASGTTEQVLSVPNNGSTDQTGDKLLDEDPENSELSKNVKKEKGAEDGKDSKKSEKTEDDSKGAEKKDSGAEKENSVGEDSEKKTASDSGDQGVKTEVTKDAESSEHAEKTEKSSSDEKESGKEQINKEKTEEIDAAGEEDCKNSTADASQETAESSATASQPAAEEESMGEDPDGAAPDIPASSTADEKETKNPTEKTAQEDSHGKNTAENAEIAVGQEEQAGESVSTDPMGTMLPIKEEKAYLVLGSNIDPTKVPLETIFEELVYGDGSKVEIDSDSKAVWAYVKDAKGKAIHDEYHEIEKGATLDLSSISPSNTTYVLEMIVGKGKQLDYTARRFIVRVFIGDSQAEVLTISLWRTDKNGKRSKVEPKDTITQLYTGGMSKMFVVPEIAEGDQYYIGIDSLLDEHPLLNTEACTVWDYLAAGLAGNKEPVTAMNNVVNVDMKDGKNGLAVSPGTDQDTVLANTFVLCYTNAKTGTIINSFDSRTISIIVSTDAQNFADEAFADHNGQWTDVMFTSTQNVLYDNLSYSTNEIFYKGFKNVTGNVVILKNGYSADAEYYYALDAHSLIWEDANEHVTGAYNGLYQTAEEAVSEGKRDIKDELIPKDGDRTGRYGYKANYNATSGGQEFTVFFDDDTSFRFIVRFEEFDPALDYYMKDYDAAPIVGSQDPWFHMTGLMLDGRELDTYIVENGKSINMDTYYGYGYQTIMVNEVLSEDQIARLVPLFEVGDPDRVEIRLPGSDQPLVSGKSKVDFSGWSKYSKDDDITNMVAIIDGHTKNYQVRVISKASGPKLYVYDDYTDKGGDRFREILLNDYFEEKHDILIANVGDAPLTGLKVRLELDENANHVKLDDYWNVGGNGNDTLEPFTTTQDLSTYGMIPNIAKVRLIPDGEGDIEGKLIISADGQDDVVIYLSNHARQPEIINDEIRDAVRWVPYSYIIATNNMYDWNTQTFEISEGELPPGLRLNSRTGEIYGAPLTEEERDYEYTFTVKVNYSRDDYFKASEKQFTIKVLDNEDETVYGTSDDGYEIVGEDINGKYETGHIGEEVSDHRFEIESFDQDQYVFISDGEIADFDNFILWLNGERLLTAYRGEGVNWYVVNDDDEGFEITSEGGFELEGIQVLDGSTVIVINREVLEEKSNKNGERNTISAEFDKGGERGDDMKRTSQNYYVVEKKNQGQGQTEPGDSPSDESKDDDADSGPQSEDSGTDDDSSDSGSVVKPARPYKPTSRQDEKDADKPAQGEPATEEANKSGNRTNGSGTTKRSSGGNGSSGSGAAASTAAAVTINARLVDTAGSALSGYTIEMHSTVKKGQTNASGVASFSGMEMGSHTLYVLNSGGTKLASEQFTLQKGTGFSRSGNKITVVPGQTITMTITLDGNRASITDVSAATDNTAAGAATGDVTDVNKWILILLAATAGMLILMKIGKKKQETI